jgi:Flp pilus assembly protein TadD
MAGNFDLALKAAKEAVKLEPDIPMAHNNLAVALYYNKDFKAAQKSLAKAKELGYAVDQRLVEAIEKEL